MHYIIPITGILTNITDSLHFSKKVTTNVLSLLTELTVNDMSEISKADIHWYNNYMGVETLHPLVSVIDYSKLDPIHSFRINIDFYAVFMKDTKTGSLTYGRNYYDYQEGSIVCAAPGQVLGTDAPEEVFQPKGWGLLFHPDLIYGTSLASKMKKYTFFSYESNEALHLSKKEQGIILDCFNRILEELNNNIDNHSQTLVSVYIELLLDYCVRFYERQFITRKTVNKDILTRFENLLEDYFETDSPQTIGLPTVKSCADQLFLSPNYFGDLIKKETGKTAQEYIQIKIIGIAKDRLQDSSKTISEIAYELGFQYVPHFNRSFKKIVGCTPNEYRTQAS